ncbi:MAG: DUF4118 domain-containing protein [Agathobacter sp.]|nr:DUF4118 domain-containing protein [Agathobacter sp.]
MSQKNITAGVTNEHVLVCLSNSPANQKVIDEAAKLAKAFNAQFTALHVLKSQEDKLSPIDQTRLQNNIRYAEDRGAAITTVIGDSIHLQIREFARISGVTKIVIGKTTNRRAYLFEKQTVTEKLITIAPNMDIYVIPVSKVSNKHKRRRKIVEQIIPTWKDLMLIAAILFFSTGVSLCFSNLGFTEANTIAVYILGVLLSAILTSTHLCSVISSMCSVLLFNYFFTEPRFTLHAYEPGYTATFLIMLIAAMMTGTLAYRLKDNAREAASSAYHTKVLFDTNQLLQKSRTSDEVFQAMANQVILLLKRDVVVYPVANGVLGSGYIYARDSEGNNALCMDSSEKKVVQWVLENKKRAGATTKVFPHAQCLYMAIRIKGAVYGIVGIRIGKNTLNSFEYSILLSILGECALALENLENEKAKEEASLVAQKEKLRANLLRTISHDLRTPLTSISGNASNLVSHYKMLDDATREQMFSDIYDDSEWLIQLVENLLSVTRIENGEMQLNKSIEIMDDVVDEAIKHIDRNKTEHSINVCRPEDLVIANMDAKLISQVIINIINNAIKYTQKGSDIQILYGERDNDVFVQISDNGPGLSDKMKSHAFDMFYSEQNKIADSKRSMGLGLALCKSVVEAHGGSIEVRDNNPSGCVFTFYLEKGEVSIDE